MISKPTFNPFNPDFRKEVDKLVALSDGELISLVMEDPILRGYLGESCAPAYYRDAKWYADSKHYPERFKKWFSGWSRKDWENFQKKDEHAVAYWAPKIVDALNWYSSTPDVKAWWEELEKDREAERLMKLQEFYDLIPKEFKNATVDTLTGGALEIAVKITSGTSGILYGGNGVGKSHLGWAVVRNIKENKGKAHFFKMFSLNAVIGAAATSGVRMDKFIDEMFVSGNSLLVVDEVDKVEMGGATFKNFSYLVDRRCEEQLPTVLLCNAANPEELEAKLGSSIISRFKSKTWPAEIWYVGTKDKRGTSIQKAGEPDV